MVKILTKRTRFSPQKAANLPFLLSPQTLFLCHARSSTKGSTLLVLWRCLATTLWSQKSQRTHVPPNTSPSTKRSESSLTQNRLHFNCLFMMHSVQRLMSTLNTFMVRNYFWMHHVTCNTWLNTFRVDVLPGKQPSKMTLLFDLQTAYTIPILAFAFVCHPEVLPIYTELKK